MSVYDDCPEDEAVLNGEKSNRPNPHATDTFIMVANSLGCDARVEVYEDGGQLHIIVNHEPPISYGWPMLPNAKTRIVGLERKVLNSLFPHQHDYRTYGPAKFGHQLPQSQSRYIPLHCFTVKAERLKAVVKICGVGVAARFGFDKHAGITRIDIFLIGSTN